MQHKITLTTEQEEALSDLGRLIAFGNVWITKIASKPNSIAGLGDRKKLFDI